MANVFCKWYTCSNYAGGGENYVWGGRRHTNLLLLMLNFLGFVGAVHPSKWQMFHCTADKCLVDSTKALVCQEASRLLQEIPSMTCSCSYHIYLADPIEFLFTHDPRTVCKT